MRSSRHASPIPRPIIIIPRKASLRFVEGSALETALKESGITSVGKKIAPRNMNMKKTIMDTMLALQAVRMMAVSANPTARKHNVPALNASQSQKKFPEISTISPFLGNSVNSIFLRPPHLFVGVGLVPVRNLPNGIASTDFVSLVTTHQTLLRVIPWKSSSQ